MIPTLSQQLSILASVKSSTDDIMVRNKTVIHNYIYYCLSNVIGRLYVSEKCTELNECCHSNNRSC